MRKRATNMLEIAADLRGWQKWESLWEPIDDDLYLKRRPPTRVAQQLPHMISKRCILLVEFYELGKNGQNNFKLLVSMDCGINSFYYPFPLAPFRQKDENTERQKDNKQDSEGIQPI